MSLKRCSPATGSSTGVAGWGNGGGTAAVAALRLSDAVPPLFTPVSSSFKGSGLRCEVAPTMPSADFCLAVKASSPAFSRRIFRCRDTRQISRGKTRILPRIDAGFTKCSPFADGRLGGHVPTGPGCINLAGRPGATGTYSSPVTNSLQDCLSPGSASYPVFVHRPAISPWTSSAPRLAATHLPFG
jgi:hypothetical protein